MTLPSLCAGTLAHSPQRAQARLGEMPGEALLAHVPVATQTAGVPPTLPGPLPSALGQPPQLPLTIPTSASDPTTWRLCSCDTGELLPAKLVAKITASQFMELHEFLPKPLLEAAQPRSTNSCTCCQASNTPPQAQKTIADIFTWLLCYHRYAAAVASIAPQRVPGMLAHANNIIQAAQQFEGDGWRVYDRAFRLQAAASVTQDWGTMNIPLYARTFMGASARRFVCRFCCSREHQSHQCPWGVDTPSLRPATNRPAPARPVSLGESVTPTCTSWNAGPCRFPTSCRYRHVCSNCGEQHPRTACRNPLPTVPEAKRPAIR